MITLIRMPRHNFEMSLKIAINECLTMQCGERESMCVSIRSLNYQWKVNAMISKWERKKEKAESDKKFEAIDPNVTRPWAFSITTKIQTTFVSIFLDVLSLGCGFCCCYLLSSIVQKFFDINCVHVLMLSSIAAKKGGENEK